jgi:aminoglycoside phosphotransferase (APT) family kinase protein
VHLGDLQQPHLVSDEPLDPTDILDALGVVGPARAIPVSGGADTLIWRVEANGQFSALRLFRPEQAELTQREVAAMAAARSAGLPVPRVHAEGIWRNRPVLHMSWMPGRPLRDELRAHPIPWRARALGVQFGRVQATVHAVPPPEALLAHPTPWIDWADPDDALRDCLFAAARGPEALLHLDFHPMNVLVADGRISAVLDWANARIGDPRADLARTASILHFAPLDSGMPRPLESIVRRAFIAGWRRGYREIAGPVRGMAPFYSWAGAVMICDLSPRLGRPDLPWLDLPYLERVRRGAYTWRERAGCMRS